MLPPYQLPAAPAASLLRKRLSQTNSKINCDTVKQKKAVNDYVKKVRRWMKLRNVYVSGSEQYKELREWERANGIRQI